MISPNFQSNYFNYCYLLKYNLIIFKNKRLTATIAISKYTWFKKNKKGINTSYYKK